MALYEFRCRTCDGVFEERRPMADAAVPAVCPDGHTDTVKLLSMFAGTGMTGAVASMPATGGGGGGCCGGACGCGR